MFLRNFFHVISSYRSIGCVICWPFYYVVSSWSADSNHGSDDSDTLMIKRTISVEMIITLLQQMILSDYISNVSKNLTFILFIADENFIKLKTYEKFYNCGPSAELS